MNKRTGASLWLAGVIAMGLSAPLALAAAAPSQPWMNAHLSPDRRADVLVAAMSRADKLHMIRSVYGAPGGPRNLPMPKGPLGRPVMSRQSRVWAFRRCRRVMPALAWPIRMVRGPAMAPRRCRRAWQRRPAGIRVSRMRAGG